MKILKPKEVSQMLNVTVKTLQNWDYSGKKLNGKRANRLKKIAREVDNDD